MSNRVARGLIVFVIGTLLFLNGRLGNASETDILINEIMYNPADTNTGGEFVEIYNRGGEAVEVGGWWLEDSTQVMFTLPAGVTIAAGGYLVFYDDTAAVSFYGLNTSISYGPYTGGLDGGGERIALKNAGGTVIDEVIYDDNWPWPSEADGTGPSLELLDAWLDNSDGSSWGIGQPYTPAAGNNPSSPGLGAVVITELMYNPGVLNTGGEYIEVYNRSGAAIPLAGWQLAGGIEYTFPAATLDAGAYLVVAGDPNGPGFYGISNWVGPYTDKLNNGGELVVLKNSLGQLVDVVNYEDAAPWPSEADGFGPALELLDINSDNNNPAHWGVGQPYTPGTANAPAFSGGGDIVITEIMYQPVKKRYMATLNNYIRETAPNSGNYWQDGDDPESEYIEIFNRAAAAIDLTGWQLLDEEGILYEFTGGSLAPASYLAVCSDTALIISTYGISNAVGNFTTAGDRLSNAGERLTLVDENGVVVDTVDYDDTPPWPIGPDQDGLALECMDPWSDNSGGENWRGFHREAGYTNQWQYVEVTGTATSNRIYIYLNGAGEWLIDQIVVTPAAGGADIMENGSFDPDDTGWSKTGNHSGSYRTALDYHHGSGCERIVATAAGGGSTNSLNRYSTGMTTGQSYTISFWVKYLSGATTMTLRLSGSGISTTVTADGWQAVTLPSAPAVGTEVYFNSGSPGEDNSRLTDYVPTFVNGDDMKHSPKRPTSADRVTITARVTGTDSLTAVTLDYQVYTGAYQSPSLTQSVAMYDDGLHGDGLAGDGRYGVTIPARSSRSLVRYRVTVTDTNSQSWTYPDAWEPNPNRAYFVYDGEYDTNLPVYFLIAPQATWDYLYSNIWTHDYQEATLVVDGIVYDHVGVHLKGMGWRVHPKKSYKIAFNKTEYLRDMSRIDLAMHVPVVQKLSHDLFAKVGQVNLGTEMVRMYRNGTFYGVYMAEEAPNSSWLPRHGMDGAGEVFKASCLPYPNWPSTPPERYVADLDYYADASVYPQMYEKKSDEFGSYDTLIDLCDKVANTPESQIAAVLEDEVELEKWLYNWAVHVAGFNNDLIGQNFFVIKPAEPDAKWMLQCFDFTGMFAWLGTATGDPGGYTQNPYTYANKWQVRCYQNPVLKQRFLRILADVLDRYMTISQVHALVDEYYNFTLQDRTDEMNIRTEWNGGVGPFVMTEARRDAIKTFYTNRWNWLKNIWLPSQGYTPPANAHPTIALGNAYWSDNGLRVDWQYADAEGDDCTVDLYWTDRKWSGMVPIPAAANIPAAEGQFTANLKLPDNEFVERGLYIHAVIRDDQSELPGHDTGDPVAILETCQQVWQHELGLNLDFNADCYINTDDLALMSQYWLTSGEILWDVAADFSASQNPNGPWSYGWGADLAAFTLYDKTYYHPNLYSPFWYFHANGLSQGPFLWKNILFWSYGVPPGQLVQFPSAALLAKIRWTSPIDGAVSIVGTIGKASGYAGDLWMVKNGSEILFARDETAVDEPLNFTMETAVPVSVGTTIDFVQGAGNAFTSNMEHKSFDIKIGAGAWLCDGTGSFAMDANLDCSINLADFAALAGDWLRCNDPRDEDCSAY